CALLLERMPGPVDETEPSEACRPVIPPEPHAGSTRDGREGKRFGCATRGYSGNTNLRGEEHELPTRTLPLPHRGRRLLQPPLRGHVHRRRRCRAVPVRTSGLHPSLT